MTSGQVSADRKTEAVHTDDEVRRSQQPGANVATANSAIAAFLRAAGGRRAHHHGALESVIYVLTGRARMRWGERLEFVSEAGPGDFIYVPPYVPHQEINANAEEHLSCVVVRSDQEPVVVNLDLPEIEDLARAQWVDRHHPAR